MRGVSSDEDEEMQEIRRVSERAQALATEIAAGGGDLASVLSRDSRARSVSEDSSRPCSAIGQTGDNAREAHRELLGENYLLTERHLKSLVSLDAFEAEREKRKLAKRNECLLNKRKMGYSKEAREMILAEMKLRNQLLWSCELCQITSGKPGMEKHLTGSMHWENIEKIHNTALDNIEPPTARDRKQAIKKMEWEKKQK